MFVLLPYCCGPHFWFYDRGRLGRVEIVTLRVGARAPLKSTPLKASPPPSPLPLTRPISSSLREFQHGASRTKTFAHPKKTPALQAINNIVPWHNVWFLLFSGVCCLGLPLEVSTNVWHRLPKKICFGLLHLLKAVSIVALGESRGYPCK